MKCICEEDAQVVKEPKTGYRHVAGAWFHSHVFLCSPPKSKKTDPGDYSPKLLISGIVLDLPDSKGSERWGRCGGSGEHEDPALTGLRPELWAGGSSLTALMARLTAPAALHPPFFLGPSQLPKLNV